MSDSFYIDGTPPRHIKYRCILSGLGHFCIIAITDFFSWTATFKITVLNAQCARTMCVPSPFASLSKSNDVHTRKSFNHIPITFLFIAHTHRAKYARSAEREKSHIIKITNGNKYRTVFRPVGRYRYQFQLVFHICGVYFING